MIERIKNENSEHNVNKSIYILRRLLNLQGVKKEIKDKDGERTRFQIPTKFNIDALNSQI